MLQPHGQNSRSKEPKPITHTPAARAPDRVHRMCEAAPPEAAASTGLRWPPLRHTLGTCVALRDAVATRSAAGRREKHAGSDRDGHRTKATVAGLLDQARMRGQFRKLSTTSSAIFFVAPQGSYRH